MENMYSQKCDQVFKKISGAANKINPSDVRRRYLKWKIFYVFNDDAISVETT